MKKIKLCRHKINRNFSLKKQLKKTVYQYKLPRSVEKKIQTTDNNFQITKIGKKRKQKINVVDFISVHGQQQFEENGKINSIEIKIENEKI